MNLKIFTFSTVLLFFITSSNAQTANTHTPIDDVSNITLLVADISTRQTFTLHTQPIHFFTPNNDYGFNISLEYRSETHNTTYFRLRYTFAVLNRDGTINHSEPLMGVTAPVIIPPVKKKSINDFRPTGLYPYYIHNEFPLSSARYNVTIALYRYENYQDYLEGNDNYTEGPTVQYKLYANTERNTESESIYTVSTYPNPSSDQVTIALTTVNPISIQAAPIQLTVFDKNGTEISRKNIAKTATTKNSILYNVSITHLPKGMYFFEIQQGKHTTIKTIIKE